MRQLIRKILDAFADRMAARLIPRIEAVLERSLPATVTTPAPPNLAPPVSNPPAPAGPNAQGAYSSISLDFPVTPKSRYGHELPNHPQLTAIIDRHRDSYAATLARIATRAEAILSIPIAKDGAPAGPPLENPWLPLLDIAALYHFVVERNPATYLEVGSGTSTRIVSRAIHDAKLRTRIVSIDPEPRAEIDVLCDVVIRTPFEATDLSVFDTLEPGDIVFIDNSHRALPNSDVTVFFLEAMPRIPAGVLLQIHDIFLPADYPPDWDSRFYSEQFLLAAFLLGGAESWQIELPLYYAATQPELASIVEPMVKAAAVGPGHSHGGSFWLRRL